MARRKMGRNERCWCGSGIKYKFCHFNREAQSPLTIQERIQHERRGAAIKRCLHPLASRNTCRGAIIKAHTVQKNGGLNRIAQDHHVYNFVPDISKAFTESTYDIEARRIGINNASTFTGFCSFHDDTTFAPIEKYHFKACEEHAFLLAYRAICKELYLKTAEKEIMPSRKLGDRGKNVVDQLHIQTLMHYYEQGNNLGLEVLEKYKKIYDQVLVAEDFAEVSYYILHFSGEPEFVCSGAMMPEYDFQGKTLQDFSEDSIRYANHLHTYITFSMIATDSACIAVFAWTNPNAPSVNLIESLHALNDVDIPHAIIRYCFEHFDNLYVSPRWWDGLTELHKNIVLKRQLSGVVPNIDRRSDCLKDDGVRVTSMRLVSRATNIAL